jgi:hypothetical protein
LPRHCDQGLDRALLQQERGRLVPAEWRPSHIAALLTHHGVEAQSHLISPLGGDQQHTTLALHDVAQPGLPCAQSACEIEENERLAGTPLARHQPMPNRRDEPLDQPGFDRPHVGIAMGIEPRQVGVVLRQLLTEIIIVIIVELWIVGFIL